uniref:Uncharacterized protein n=1 Tax=Kwoniella bestiolae CBS 10118 TaxID=1296100 RepID=A0A1B9FR47_9TREE|nr:hypothetical protein I302_08908 [Kwoniella bestiolae CBS 10118]OCF21236.1 hypothetical protein I302_08908 [Kwoniella bestiolae CBS 10118]
MSTEHPATRTLRTEAPGQISRKTHRLLLEKSQGAYIGTEEGTASHRGIRHIIDELVNPLIGTIDKDCSCPPTRIKGPRAFLNFLTNGKTTIKAELWLERSHAHCREGRRLACTGEISKRPHRKDIGYGPGECMFADEGNLDNDKLRAS